MKERIKGLPASQGTAIGPAWIFRPIQVKVERRIVDDPQAEWARLEKAFAETRTQLQTLHDRAAASIGAEEAEIFEAHQLFLEDPDLLDTLRDLIDNEHLNAEGAVQDGVEKYAQMMLELEEEYFKARAQDIRDVGRRVLYSLAGVRVEDTEFPFTPVVIISEDLTPSDTVQFERENILGLVTLKGGPTSHTAILARSLGVPAVVSAPISLDDLQPGTPVIVSGSEGWVLLDPDEAALAEARAMQSEEKSKRDVQLSQAHAPAVTLDGKTVEVVANIGGVEDARQAVSNGAEGVGLLRTEFLYLSRQSMPTEDEQVAIYREIVEVMAGRPLVVRTLDIGGDKQVSYLGIQQEANPFLGWRAIRMISERPDLLLSQLRALLRAGAQPGADLRIMLPMISSLDEVLQAKQIYSDARESLIAENLPCAEHVQFGIMVEIPSAALLVPHIATAVDFFSIGTNDLTQYTLAVDRTNERVAHLASNFHPAVIQLIAQTIRSAHEKGKWVGLCGEMAGDPRAVPLLLGLGLDEFSMAAQSVPVVKQLLRRLSFKECQEIAAHALTLPTTAAVQSYLKETALQTAKS